ncbi:MAG: hypothetical protein NMK33_01360 [Candidatus Cardinium sp.]|uniref:hypothetical protein n=1 Tax=Cardinium endosymbiont of Dermatophagoides farinae TaxID=2597823 RepID=UPI001184249E|nr:hypothetical protein [Cardinium endosymbiont of Dermatophagoides farinae]TSJ81152.1 hypothetical protein FPG78_04035 [Cardinium endosymbiont of Dermatophagoides farinae]UWW97200.1 MAG: hypothetical protein NMK33_01360 [Candidatus Cardinium sp.]
MAIKVKKTQVGLGIAPRMNESKITNLTKYPSDQLVTMNFKVTAELRRAYKKYALEKDKSMVEILKESFDLYRSKNI